MQSRRWSFIEALTNIAVGYVVAIMAQALILPLYGVHLAPREHAAIGGFFTAVSLVRSYLLRRAFNRVGLRRL